MNRSSIAQCRLAALIAIALMGLPFQLVAEQVFPDPEGDLIGLDPDAPDATALVVTDLGDSLRLEIELTDPAMASEVTGLVELDTSVGIDNPTSDQLGAVSRLSLLCPKSTGLGVNRTIDLFARNGSDVQVRDSEDQIIGTALWEETSAGFALTVGKNLIGFDIGLIEMAVIIGTPQQASDCVPDAGEFTRATINLDRVIVEAAAGPGGAIEPAGSIIADVDESITFDLLPGTGYSIDSVTGSCAGTLDENELTFTTEPVIESCDLEVLFAINIYTVTTNVTNGRITSVINPEVEHASATTVTGEADVGHHFSEVSGCGGIPQSNTDQSVIDFSYTTGLISADCTVTAAFAINTYQLGGRVNGLSGGGLALTVDAGEMLSIDDNGAFVFYTRLEHETPWSVTVADQPSNPSQTCTVSNGSGTGITEDVDDIEVTCSTDTFSIGGEVFDLEGEGLSLSLNGEETLPISDNGSFTFPTELADLSSYNVTVETEPTNPSQTCSVANGEDNLAGADVTNLSVTCTTDTFTIGGEVFGLEGNGLVLQNNGGDELPISEDGTFVFTTSLIDQTDYNVTVAIQPTDPIQTCSVAGGSDTLAGANVTDVEVQCTTEPSGIAFDMAVLDFGDLFGKEQMTLVVTATNSGTGELDIEEILGPEPPFVLTGGSCLATPMQLQPETSCDLEVTFSAEHSPAGEHASAIEVVSNAASSPDHISVRGSVMAPIPVPVLGPLGLIALALLLMGLAGRSESPLQGLRR